VTLLVGVLLLAFLSARACHSSDGVSSERAVALAREAASFSPDRSQVRLVQRGVPPRQSWAVSLYDVSRAGRPTRVEVFLVDRRSGTVTKAG